jgi:hypothetical protein
MIGHSEIAERISLLRDSRPEEMDEILNHQYVSVEGVATSIMARRAGVDGGTIRAYFQKRLPRRSGRTRRPRALLPAGV